MLNYHRERFRKLYKSFTVVIQHLSTRLIKPNFFLYRGLLRLLSYMPMYLRSCDVIELVVLCLIG